VLARQAADLIERALAEERTKQLLREVSHRAKNMLAVVQAMARQSANHSDVETFVNRFTSRLAGLSASQDLLVHSNWQGADIAALIWSQVCHLDDLIDTRVILHGPPLTLSAAPTQFIGMALRELATNAVKYGALSNGQGTVNISWDKVRDGRTTRFIMRWQEAGGPTVIPPQKEGFGHSVIVRLLEHGVGGKVLLTYLPEGVDWKISAPAVAVLQSGKGA
jgi:two-component sensor histidine kinase